MNYPFLLKIIFFILIVNHTSFSQIFNFIKNKSTKKPAIIFLEKIFLREINFNFKNLYAMIFLQNKFSLKKEMS